MLEYVDACLGLNAFPATCSTAVHNWGDPLPGNPWPCILGGDILYRPECFQVLLQTISLSLAPDGTAYLSDPRTQLEADLPTLAKKAGLQWNCSRPNGRYTLVSLQLL